MWYIVINILHCSYSEIYWPWVLYLSWNKSMSLIFSSAHPLLQATYTGVRITVLGNIFFPSFLAKTKRKQPLPGHIHCKFWPCSLRFWLWFLVQKSSTEAPQHCALGQRIQCQCYNCDTFPNKGHPDGINKWIWDIPKIGPGGPKIGQNRPKCSKMIQKTFFWGFQWIQTVQIAWKKNMSQNQPKKLQNGSNLAPLCPIYAQNRPKISLGAAVQNNRFL